MYNISYSRRIVNTLIVNVGKIEMKRQQYFACTPRRHTRTIEHYDLKMTHTRLAAKNLLTIRGDSPP